MIRKESTTQGRYLTDEEIKRQHEIIMEMLVEFDSFCNKNKIKYVITGGTLLGAVRHKGFIPWDDDADIAMTRIEYKKLKKLSGKLNSDTIFFQDHDTDEAYLWGYGKLRRPGTELIRAGQEHMKGVSGVFIDIFPMDDIPIEVPLQRFSYTFWTAMRKILWARVAIRNTNSVIGSLGYGALNLIPVKLVYSLVHTLLRPRLRERKRLVHPWSRPLWSRDNKKGVPPEKKYGMEKAWFLERCRYEFEGALLWGSKDADGFLKYCYDEYMELPPKDKQKPALLFSTVKM